MTDLTALLQSAEGDGVHWTLETSSDLNVNLVHLDAAHVVGEHANEVGAPHEEGGDPACWAHLFENDKPDTPR